MQIVANFFLQFLPNSEFSECPVSMGELEKLAWSGIPRSYRSRVWQILCGYQPAKGGEEVVRRKREEYAGYVDQYFNNKEEDIHKDTFRWESKSLEPLKNMFVLWSCVSDFFSRNIWIQFKSLVVSINQRRHSVIFYQSPHSPSGSFPEISSFLNILLNHIIFAPTLIIGKLNFEGLEENLSFLLLILVADWSF